MRKAYSLLFFLLLAAAAEAQNTYFIYFQTEGGTPFYLKMGEKVMSSSSGYFILPELTDSIYTVAVGFPSARVESRFRLPVSGADQGFLIRNPGNAPTLSNLSSGATVAPFVDEADRNITYQERTDAFTALLSRAAGDPTLLFAAVRPTPLPVATKDAPVAVPKAPDSMLIIGRDTSRDRVATKPDNTPTPSIIKSDTTASVTTPSVTTPVSLPPTTKTAIDTTATVVTRTEAPPVQTAPPPDTSKAIDVAVKQAPPVLDTVQTAEPPYVRSKVKKHAESSTGEGFGLVYYDNMTSGIDTIRLLIPNPRIVLKPRDAPTDDGGMLNRSDLKPSAPPVDSSVATTPAPLVIECKATATQSDFLKLRKAMAGKASDEGMVDEAKRSFRSRCFTTDQLRSLAGLFNTAAGKYQFFDAAYSHVSDPAAFPSLSAEIRDDYYLKRFKALIGQ